ncbi:MAG: pyrimidine-nucleoside phosphorylase [Liquorilactobacillus nagelii]|uniref:pyrimidine-nucleoside phosphorylase n=1 Tax=Liquorilactobacillus nagelii TaxID=82688 RepID=UPI0039E7E86B
MRMIDIIDKKKNNQELTKTELQFFIDGVVNNTLPDYQISALLMAIYFQGMSTIEQFNLTMIMMNSGEQINLSSIPGIKVDKHSTGGVGDKVSLPLVAMVAATGIPVPMISGRGLGHTGGTLDKLEAIPGFNVDLSESAFINQINKIGVAIVSASHEVAPADKKLYALRDVTDTVNSIPLIASSIMSKKIASGTDALVIDVKTGAGAFMKKLSDAENLAHALVNIGKKAGINCKAVITDISQPLGFKIGNSLEIEETLDLLKGQGPDDLLELVLTLGSQMVLMGKKAVSLHQAREILLKTISEGTALSKFKEMVNAQGGDPTIIDDYSIMPQATFKIPFKAKKSGFIEQLSAEKIGIASMLLGGGRQKLDDKLDYSVGIELHKKIGDPVTVDETILTVHSNQKRINSILSLLDESVVIGVHATKPTLIHEIIN